MAIKVIACDSAWKGFLRRAKSRHPIEYIEAIWGYETPEAFRITDFHKIKVNKKETDHTKLDYNDIEIKRQVWLAEKEGKQYLGTVHTHPRSDYDTCASTLDHHASDKAERVMGIVLLYKKKEEKRFTVEVDWWFPQKKIEFELLPE